MVNSKNLLFAIKKAKAINIDVLNLLKDLEYVLTAEDLTAEEFDLVRDVITKFDKIATILQGNKNA